MLKNTGFFRKELRKLILTGTPREEMIYFINGEIKSITSGIPHPMDNTRAPLSFPDLRENNTSCLNLEG